MTAELGVHTTAGPTPLADRIGRGLAVLCVLATLVAFADGVGRMAGAPDDRLWVEGWRTFAYLVFAGLLALVAARPRGQRGVWELVIAQKSALVVFSFVIGNVNEARLAGLIDFGLVVTVAVAYVLCRGWYAWRTTVVEPTGDRLAG